MTIDFDDVDRLDNPFKLLLLVVEMQWSMMHVIFELAKRIEIEPGNTRLSDSMTEMYETMQKQREIISERVPRDTSRQS